ncbi:MAG: elongation factor P [Gemmatimonadota bacterium]|jgi:elongation factor P|nr:elongation factor P [Gemmatimonadota bacterium]MDP6530178.1 elongation factor P [Gemmatimonadota bacterium]MDP6802071.1 elongation factor P [Gemmatimonadota bacterium]MDP7032451.1 elongation factor P [Gemmatimonadota bacterium]
MTTTNDFRNGMTVVMNGNLMIVVEFLHVKPGKGGAFVRSKLKNVRTGAVVEKTWRAGEKVEEIRLDRKALQFLYREGNLLHVMDQETFEQMALDVALLGESAQFLSENEIVTVLLRDGSAVTAEVPNFVELEVTETDPGVRGDTAQGGAKPAKLETGAVVNVPLFIEVGDRLKVDTRNRSYVERVKG